MMPADWHVSAACRGSAEADLFFAPQTPLNVARALEICHGCPVQTDCADEALTGRIEHGIWGGLTEDDRAAIWRQELWEAAQTR
ncbi:WhiB family transcriptional regulator, partial [Prauserella rugosa]|uniref:Transcriptional regulator WhiB n=1 Tax=Prauserella rugosa TaxID=43354 RepID=A0A660C3K3_9PSEU